MQQPQPTPTETASLPPTSGTQQAAPAAVVVADDPFLSDSLSNSSENLSDDFVKDSRKRRSKGARRPRSKDSDSLRSEQSRHSDWRYRRSPQSQEDNQNNENGDNRRKRRRDEERSRSREHKSSRGDAHWQRGGNGAGNDQRITDERDNNYRGGGGGNHHQQMRGAKRFRSEKDGEYDKQTGIFTPRLSKPLVSQQLFAQLQNKHIQNLSKEYEAYKSKHTEQHQSDFMRENENDSWFREKYDPTYRFLRWKHMVVNARKQSASQHEDYVDPNYLSVCIKSVPAWVHINQIQDVTNCTQIYFSEPLKMSDFDRICWLKFSSQQDYDHALNKTISIQGERNNENYTTRPVKSNLTLKGTKQMIPLKRDADDRDFQLALKIVQVLDLEYQTNVNLTGLSNTWDKLSFLVKYMWKVFGYAFYSGVKSEDERSIAIKCFQYERNSNYVDDSEEISEEAAQFEQKYLNFAQQILTQGALPVPDPMDDPLLAEKRLKYCLKKCLPEKAEKYTCELCDKSFCGEEFVVKHINNKHQDEIEKEVLQRYFRLLARNAYIADKDKIEGAPIAHSFTNYAVGGNKGGQRRDHQPRRDNNNKDQGQQQIEGQQPGAAGAQVGANGEPQPEKKEYVDYDDPMTTKQLQMKRQIAITSNATAGCGLKEKSQINYDDLF